MSNQDSTQNVPALRLDGFEGVWIAQQLSEFLEKSTISNDDLAYGREDVYAVSLTEGLVNQIKFHGRSFAGKNLDNYDVVLHGDVVYTKSPLSDTPFGIVKCNSGEPGLVSPLYAVYHPKAGISPHFVQHYFALHSRLNDYLRPLVSKGAKNTMNITDDQALAGEVIFPPTLEEQQAIRAIFTNLDTIIRSHRKKLDLLKQTKTSLLQRMFPQDGATVPELRLDGFTDDWKEKTLGDTAADFQSGGFLRADDITQHGSYPVYGGNGLRGYTDKYNHSGLYTLIGRQGALCGNINTSDGKAYFTEHAIAVKANREHDTLFLSHLFGVLNLGQYSAQSAQPGLAVGTIKEVKTRVPSLEEQRSISAVFTKLDTLISAEAQYIDKLTQTKTALLQKMFV